MSHCLDGDCRMGGSPKSCYCECPTCSEEREAGMCEADYQVGDLSIRAEPGQEGWRIAVRDRRSTLYFDAGDERSARARAAVLADMIREGVLS